MNARWQKPKQVGHQQLAKGRGGVILKRIIEKVVVLEGGRGVKCVVKREEREGRAATLVRDFACSGVPFWMLLVSGDASILTYVSVAAASSAWRSLAAVEGGGVGGGQMLLPATFLLPFH